MVLRLAPLVLLVLLTPQISSAQTAPRIRVLDPVMRELFEQGVAQSPTLRGLAETVQAGSILVFVECDIRLPAHLGARLTFVTSVNALRYVHVAIECTLPARRQVALLAHELQHAIEIGGRRDIVDIEAMESLYEDIGFQSFEHGRHKRFETSAAIAAEDAVTSELAIRVSFGYGTY